MNIGREIAVLERMSVDQLRGRYAEAFGEATSARHKQWLVRRIAWRLQALAEGGLSERARQRARELANEADLRLSAPKIIEKAKTALPLSPGRLDARLPIPGTVITRDYKGQTLQVRILDDGFEYEGASYKSLSAVAKAITGSHCNGYLFFRLANRGGDR